MAEFSANAIQTVQPGEAIIFTSSNSPCWQGLVRHRDETGSFLLSGRRTGCNCMRRNQTTEYLTDFGANLSIPEGGTVEEISVAFAIDGTVLPGTTMRLTPTAVDVYDNVSRATNIPIWNNCCQSVSVVNTSTQPINVQNANIIFALNQNDSGNGCGY